jgi:hypothetical protein
MPHDKLPEQELADVAETLQEIKDELPDSASGNGLGPRSEVVKAINNVQKARTDISKWREFVDDAEVLD